MYRIAIVEDDPMVARIHQQFLEGFEAFRLIKILSSGLEAREWLLSNDVELIILDLFIPRINGLELLAALRQSDKKAEVIVVSAANDKETIQRAYRLGVFDYLIKPFSFQRLSASLEAYVQWENALQQEALLTQKQLDRLMNHKSFSLYNYNNDVSKSEEGDRGLEEKTKDDSFPQELWEADDTKGIQRETLHYIAEYLMLLKEGKSAGELAENLELGRVTIRRYLEFLYEKGAVTMSIEYGSVGRPKYLYRWKPREQYEQYKP